MELRADDGGPPGTPTSRTAQNAEQRADGQSGAHGQPRIKLLPGPAVHPDLAALAALTAPHEDRAADRVQVTLGQRQRLADPQPGTPQHDDQTAQPHPIRIITRSAHHGDDLLNRRWVWRVLQALIAWWSSLVTAGKVADDRRLRAMSTPVVDAVSSSLRRWLTTPWSRAPTTVTTGASGNCYPRNPLAQLGRI
jgi:hypothetical protein